MTTRLPSGWTSVRVRDLARSDEQPVLTGPFGTNIGREDFVADGVPVLTIGCLTDSGINVGKAMFVKPDKAEELERYRLREGDLLFSRMASVGRAGMVPRSLQGALFNYHIMRLRLSDALMLPQLFMAYVRGAPAVQQYLEDVNHGATRDGINTTQLLDMPVVLPPLNEQRRIVAKLESLQSRSRRAREALDAVPPLLEKLRQSILAAAFRGDLTKDWRAQNPNPEPASALLARIRTERRQAWETSELVKLKANGKPSTNGSWKAKYKEPEPLKTTGLPDLPPGWCWATLEEVCPVFVDCAHRTPAYSSEGIPALRPRDVVGGELDLSKVARIDDAEFRRQTERRVPEAGDIIYSRELSLGWAVTVPKDVRLCMSQGMVLFRPGAEVLPQYLTLFLNGPGRRRTLKAAVGTAHPHLNLSEIRSHPIPLAPIAEQRRLEALVLQRLAAIAAVAVSTDAASKTVQSLNRAALAKAFRGELVPRDPADEADAVTVARLGDDARAALSPQRKRRAKASE